MAQLRRSISKKTRMDSWYHYIGEAKGEAYCLCCDIVKINQFTFHSGHIVPASLGGDCSIDNILPICAPCNLSMSTCYMDDFQ